MESWNLPINYYDKVVFVDWHGVLSSRPFWSSLKGEERRQLHLAKLIPEIFQSYLVDLWMCGETSTAGVLRSAGVAESDIHRLTTAVFRECQTARPRQDLMKEIRSMRQRSLVVLASDNMDCFSQAIKIRSNLSSIFDDYLVSSDLGVLKAQPIDFFGPWLEASGLQFEQAVLIDDSLENCRAFEAVGGKAIVFDGSVKSLLADAVSM
jgi:FMN phosphatase YigB (HAD superfamily)